MEIPFLNTNFNTLSAFDAEKCLHPFIFYFIVIMFFVNKENSHKIWVDFDIGDDNWTRNNWMASD